MFYEELRAQAATVDRRGLEQVKPTLLRAYAHVGSGMHLKSALKPASTGPKHSAALAKGADVVGLPVLMLVGRIPVPHDPITTAHGGPHLRLHPSGQGVIDVIQAVNPGHRNVIVLGPT